MRVSLLLRLCLMLLIATVPVATAVLAPPAAIVSADDGDDAGDDDRDDEEDHPGNSNPPGNAKGHEKDKDKEKQESNNSDRNGKSIATLEQYSIAVECAYDTDADQTTCEFTGMAPDDGKKVNFVQVPMDLVCAEVVETEATLADPDPNTHVTGYKSPGNDDAVTLMLAGEVTTIGTTNYWIKAANNVFPAPGPGIACLPVAAEADTASENDTTTMTISTPTPTPEPATGTLVVNAYTCTDIPDDRTDYDWFGACVPGGTTATFTLTPDGGDATVASADTGETGAATFSGIEPGMWELDMESRTWCHAKSDKVTAEGDVVVESGQTSSVWIFLCEAKGQ